MDEEGQKYKCNRNGNIFVAVKVVLVVSNQRKQNSVLISFFSSFFFVHFLIYGAYIISRSCSCMFSSYTNAEYTWIHRWGICGLKFVDVIVHPCKSIGHKINVNLFICGPVPRWIQQNPLSYPTPSHLRQCILQGATEYAQRSSLLV